MKEQKRSKKPIIILIALIVIALAGTSGFYGIKQRQKANIYSQAEQCFQQKDYSAAKELFTQLGSYKDSAEWVTKCDSQPELDSAASLMKQGKYEQAREIYKKYNLQDNYNECTYQLAISYATAKDYEKSLKEFEQISSYKDVKSKIQDCAYKYGRSLFKDGKYSDAKTCFEIIGDYKKAKKYLDKCNLANKYSAFDINGSYLGGLEPDDSTLIELYEYMESWFDADFYGTWYNASGDSIVIDKFSISGVPYYITGAIINSHPEFDYQYENTTGFHHFTFESSSDPIREDIKTIIFDDTVRYYNIGGAELQEFLERQDIFIAEQEKEEEEWERQRQKQANENNLKNETINKFEDWYKNGSMYKIPLFHYKNWSITQSNGLSVVEMKASSIAMDFWNDYNVTATFLVENDSYKCISFDCNQRNN